VLRSLSEHFELILFTASHSCYASAVLAHLDPHSQFIAHRLFREHCI
jgi:CTD small phosphatase-like protein 2